MTFSMTLSTKTYIVTLLVVLSVTYKPFMLSVIMLNVVMLCVVAPVPEANCFCNFEKKNYGIGPFLSIQLIKTLNCFGPLLISKLYNDH
jgi:hypothetical protein